MANAKPAVESANRVHAITRDELPLYCPRDDMPLWSSHPRVYLAIEETGEAVCPYCGTKYILK